MPGKKNKRLNGVPGVAVPWNNPSCQPVNSFLPMGFHLPVILANGKGFSNDVNLMRKGFKRVQTKKPMPSMPRSSELAEQPATARRGGSITMRTTCGRVRDAL